MDLADLSPTELFTDGWSQPALTPGHAKITLLALQEIPTDELHAALCHLINTHQPFRPAAALIRRTVIDRRGLFPSEGEAGAQAKVYAQVRRQRDYGGPQPTSGLPAVHPAVATAVDAVGVNADAVASPSFTKAYREARQRLFDVIQAGDLSEAVAFTPVSYFKGHMPDAIVWHHNGWRTPTGELVHADSGLAVTATATQLALTGGNEG